MVSSDGCTGNRRLERQLSEKREEEEEEGGQQRPLSSGACFRHAHRRRQSVHVLIAGSAPSILFYIQ